MASSTTSPAFQTGTRTMAAGRYDGTAAADATALSTVDYGLGHGLQPSSYQASTLAGEQLQPNPDAG